MKRCSRLKLLMLLSLSMAGTAANAEDVADMAANVRRTNETIRFANYPEVSLRRGEEGVVGIVATTDKQGRLIGCDVVRSSGYAALDEASCDFLLRYGKMKPFLSPDGRTIAKRQEGSVVWQLPVGYPRPATPPVKTANLGMPEKRICHTQMRTGSLADRQRICMTQSEWNRQINGAQQDLREMRPHYLPGQ